MNVDGVEYCDRCDWFLPECKCDAQRLADRLDREKVGVFLPEDLERMEREGME